MAQQPQNDPWVEAAKNFKPQEGGSSTPEGGSDDWKLWQGGEGEEQPHGWGLSSIMAGTTPLHKAFDKATTVTPEQEAGHSPILNRIQEFGAGAIQGAGQPFVHPLKTLESAGNMIAHPLDTAHQEVNELYQNPGQTIARGLGNMAGGAIGGEALSGIGRGIGNAGSTIAKSVGEAAKENPDVAALKGLNIAPKSKATLQTLKSIQGARPFLQGAQSLEDLQAKVPAAKSEIWAPYQQAIDAIGPRPIMGPDGITTVGDLEAERLQLSAINRGLKSKIPDPESVKLAEQKGLTQAQLLAKEKAVKAALLPELAKTGINPQAILKAFGQVSKVGENVSGRSSLGEATVPTGLAKIGKLSLEKPLQAPQQVWGGLRDIAAGRSLFGEKPSDLGIREGFRTGGPKPDFGKFQQPMVKGLLPPPSPEDLPLHNPFIDATNARSYDFSKSPFPVPTVEGAKNINLQGVLKRSR